jgi:putative toxin-antitoxin system antitoxin component (TIGR02293 family)
VSCYTYAKMAIRKGQFVRREPRSPKTEARKATPLVKRLFGTSDPARIHAAIEDGKVSGDALLKIRESLGLAKAQLAPILAMRNERTISRREESTKGLPAAEADRLYRLARIADLATQMIGDAKKAHRWLRHPVPALNGATPLDMLKSEAGTAQVEQVLYNIAYGGVA